MKLYKLITFLWVFISLVACTPYKKSIYIPEGVHEKKILIRSEPTETIIYINGEQIGKTPFKTKFFYAEDKLINIKAIPIYPNQYTQNIFMRIPPIPETMTIYMNDQPKIVYHTEEEEITVPERRPPIVVRDTTYIDNIIYYNTPVIHFDFDKHEIKANDQKSLLNLAKFLQTNPEISVDILGSADVRGKEDYNVKLSLRRSRSVAKFLQKYGIAENRLFARGIGKTRIYDEQENTLPYQESRSVIFNLYVDQEKFEQFKKANGE